MVQKRLLSVNPAEPKMTRWALASCANAGAGTTTKIGASPIRSASTERTHTDNVGFRNVERRIRHLPRFYLTLCEEGWSRASHASPVQPAMALAFQQRHNSPLPQKRLPEEPCASTPCVQPVNPIPASHSRCHVPLRDNHVCALCYTKCLVC